MPNLSLCRKYLRNSFDFWLHFKGFKRKRLPSFRRPNESLAQQATILSFIIADSFIEFLANFNLKKKETEIKAEKEIVLFFQKERETEITIQVH